MKILDRALILFLCLGGCSADGISLGLSGCESETPFESTPENTVTRGVHATVTAAGTQFFIERAELLAGLLFPVDENGWVSLELPPIDFGDAGGGIGIGVRDLVLGFDLRSAEIDLQFLPEPTRIRLIVDRARLKLADGIVWMSLGGSAACRLGNGLEAGTPREALVEADIAVDLFLEVDEEARLRVRVEVLPFTVHALDFELVYDAELPECADGNTAVECRLTCGLGDAGIELAEAVFEALDNRLNELLQPFIEAAVNFAADRFTETPLAVEGTLHPRLLEELLPTATDAHPLAFRGGPSAAGFTIRAAGEAGDGVGLDLDLGLQAVPHPCVAPAQVEPGFMAGPPPLLSGYDHEGAPYHVGLAASAAVVNRALWVAYQAGVLCLALDSDQIEALLGQRIDTDTLSLVMPGLRELTGGPRPILVALDPFFRAEDFPLATFFEVAEQEGIPQAGVAIELPGLRLSFYALVEERWSRLFAASIDVQMGLRVQALPESKLALIVAPPQLGAVNESYNELLEGADVPGLLDLAIDLVTSALLSEDFELELPIDGLVSEFTGLPLDISIAALRTEGEAADFLSVLLSLVDAPGEALRASVETEASALAVWPGHARLKVAARGAERALYQWRLGTGAWRPLTPAVDGLLHIDEPRLRTLGRHELQLRAVAAGRPNSLDPTPVVLDLDVERAPPKRGHVARQGGCTQSPAPLATPLLLLLLLGLRRRR